MGEKGKENEGELEGSVSPAVPSTVPMGPRQKKRAKIPSKKFQESPSQSSDSGFVPMKRCRERQLKERRFRRKHKIWRMGANDLLLI